MVTHLVTAGTTTLTEKRYKAHLNGTLVVSRKWLDECHNLQERVRIDAYALPPPLPLEGCTVCVTGLSTFLYSVEHTEYSSGRRKVQYRKIG